jgi:hypothetical protein
MSAAKVKARKMWGTTENVFACKEVATLDALPWKPDAFYVLPADADSIERMAEQMALAMCDATDDKPRPMREVARAALAAIGVKAKGGTK